MIGTLLTCCCRKGADIPFRSSPQRSSHRNRGGLKPSGIAVIHCHSCKLARGPEVPKSNTKSRLRVSPISPFQAGDDSGADCTQGERPRVTKPVDRVPEDEDTDRRGPPVPVIIIRRRAVWVKSNVRYPFLWSNTSRGSQPRPHRTPRRSRAVIRWGQSITDPSSIALRQRVALWRVAVSFRAAINQQPNGFRSEADWSGLEIESS